MHFFNHRETILQGGINTNFLPQQKINAPAGAIQLAIEGKYYLVIPSGDQKNESRQRLPSICNGSLGRFIAPPLDGV